MTAPLLSFSPALANHIHASPYHFIVTGANGWLGKATLAMLYQALGNDFAARVTGLGSRPAQINLHAGQTGESTYSIQSLLEWQLPPDQPTILFHYAFLTKDKIDQNFSTHTHTYTEEEYIARNHAISEKVQSWIRTGAIRGVVLPSSGAVYDYLHGKSRSPEANLYGQLKYQDELTFSAACDMSKSKLIIPRIFNLSGPYINKFEHYALASFIAQSLSTSSTNSTITIHARHPVIRSYYFIGDLIELCLQLLLHQPAAATPLCFDVAGDDIVELGELAQQVATILGNATRIQRPPMLDGVMEDRYIGNKNAIRKLEMRFGIHPMPLKEQINITSQYIKNLY